MDEQTKIALMEQKIDNFAAILTKLDSTIEKLSEVNANVIKMLAVHEEKVAQTEKVDDFIMKLVEETNKRVDEVEKEFKDIEKEVKDIQKTRWMALGVGTLLVIFISSFGHNLIDNIFAHQVQPVQNTQPRTP